MQTLPTPFPRSATREPRLHALDARARSAAPGVVGQVGMGRVLQAAMLVLLTGNIGRIPVFSTGVREAPILINDMAMAAVLALGGIAMLQRRVVEADRIVAAALAFVALAAFSAVLAVPRHGLSGFELAISLAYLARWVFYFGIYVVVINTISRADVPRILRAFDWSVLAFAAFGIVQSAFLPNFAQRIYPDARLYLDWDPQGHRLVSTFLDPNFAGAFILFGLVLHLARIISGAPAARWKPILLFAALILTASRSSLLALFFAGLVLVAIAGISRRMLRFGALVAVLGLLALPQIIQFALTFNKLQIDASALARVVMWGRALTIFADHWILGIGYNTWGFVQARYGWEAAGVGSYGVEGGLFFIAVTTGVVGFAIYLAMMLRVGRNARALWRSALATAEERALGMAVAAMLVAIVIHSLFTNSLLLTFLMELMWIMWGLTFVAFRAVTAGEVAGAPRPSITARIAQLSVKR